MAINKTSAKISQVEIADNQLQGKTNPLKGNVSENQAVFDKLPKKIAEKFNSFVDVVADESGRIDENLYYHINHKDNPHNVTALQVGAYTKEQTEERLSVKAAEANEELNEHKSDQTNPHNVTALQVGAYTKKEVDTKLGEKANKSDIINVYSYQGSVDTFEDLGIVSALKFIPDGEPTIDGQVCGSFDQNTGVVTINEIEDPECDIVIPIKEITIKEGYYAICVPDSWSGPYYPTIGVDGKCLAPFGGVYGRFVFKIENDVAIKEIRIYKYSEVAFNGFTGNVICSMVKVQDKWVDESSGDGEGPYSTPNLSDPEKPNGTVYNVLDTGMNYAWNGTEWDALGGEHRDIEAHHRLDILGEQKADKLTTYTQTQIDDALNNKANKSEVHTKTEVSNMLNDKADKSDIYTKNETDVKLDGKADKTEIIKNVISDGSNIAFNADKNTVGIVKKLGSFTCTAIDESTNKYTFDVADTSVFEPSTEYKVTVGDADYLIRTSKINENNVVFVAVDAENKPTFDVGTAYSIRFETKNAVSFGTGNTVYANEGFATGMANFIDETADQGVANGYKNKLSGKAHFVAGSLNNVSEGDRDTVFGAANVVKGNNKFVTGIGLLAEKTSDGSIVLGQYNEDIQDALFILGKGSSDNRRNALVIDKSGNIISYGTLTVDKKVNINDATVINGTLDVNGNVTIKGVMKLNDSEVLTENTLLEHTGVDIGKQGSGVRAVIFNDNDGNGNNIASGYASFTAGASNKTTKDQGATFGYGNENNGQGSFLAGCYSKVNAGADHSAALGLRLTVDKPRQVVVGAYNEPDTTSTFIVGCGKDTPKTAMTVQEVTGFTTFYQDVEVKGRLKGNNVFPKDISFIVNGNITNQDGNLVAEYNGDKVNFSLDPNEYPYSGRRIRDCKTLIIPIEPVTLLGTYNKTGTYSFTHKDQNGRLVNNGYYLKIFADGTDGVTETDDTYIVSKPITINEVYLHRDKDLTSDDKYWNYDFYGSGYLDLSTVQLTDITAGLIGAFEEHKEADGISTSLHLTSPNGTVFKLTVADDGSLTTIRV